MCGIFGYIGKNCAKEKLIEGLENLEYRGYDSAGMAISDGETISVFKSAGKVIKLKELLNDKDAYGQVGIAHTRWATHGLPSELNAHPHISLDKNVILVHNGIIENYTELKKTYTLKTKTQADTEVVAELISKQSGTNFQKLKKTCELLKGSYALAVMFAEEPKTIYLAKKHSPLMIGTNKTEIYISSDANAFKKYSNEFFILNDNEFAIIKDKNINFYKKNKKINKKINNFNENIEFKNKNKYLMQDEILQTPDALIETEKYFQTNKKIFEKNYFSDLDKIYLIGCGTAYHSCLLGKKYLEKALSVPIFAEIASEFRYSNVSLTKNTLCIFVSQSGETADTIACVKKSKRAKTLAITNAPNSSITFECKKTLYMRAGWERAVASTKAYTCQLAMFYLLKCYIKNETSKIKLVADKIRRYLKTMNIQDLIDKCISFEKVIFIGRQADYVTSKESALKLKEISYINCIACPSGELKHGTLALVDEKTLVFVISTYNSLKAKNDMSLKEVEARGGKCLLVSQFEGSQIKLPSISQELMPMLCIIPFQILACEVSIKKGYNPDKPRNLSKSVTVE